MTIIIIETSIIDLRYEKTMCYLCVGLAKSVTKNLTGGLNEDGYMKKAISLKIWQFGFLLFMNDLQDKIFLSRNPCVLGRAQGKKNY